MLSAHKAGTYAQMPEIFKQELHPCLPLVKEEMC